MIYQKHKQHLRELSQAINEYNDALDRKVVLFQATQPSSVRVDKEGGKKTPGSGTDIYDEYLIELERSGIDARLKASRDLITQMQDRLKDDEILLGMSTDLNDQVYYMTFIERRTVPDIAARLHYSQSYIYRALKEISQN